MDDLDRSGWRMYDAVGDVEGWFPLEFRQFVQHHNLLCRNLTNRLTARNNWLFENKKETYADGFTSAVRHITINMMTSFRSLFFPLNCLVQFWRAEQAANSANDFQLTTLNQPFLLRGYIWEKPFNKEICSYRMKTRDVVITRNGKGGGPISRVFMNKRMEITPDVAYYSDEEYPQRDTALACHIKSSIIVPLSDSYGRTVGVMEFVSQSNWSLLSYLDRFLSTLPESSRMYLDHCKGLCGQYDLDKDSLRNAVSETKGVIEVLCKTFDIVFGQTWMLCKHCNSLSTSERCTKELNGSYKSAIAETYRKLGFNFILREGEGVVGRAAMSSHNLIYCKNVTKFRITTYPFAHFVQNHDLSASFAICLQSNLSGDQVYVLEFLLGPSYVDWDLRENLVPILDKMRQSFRTFKVAYGGKEIGDNLSVLVVDASSPDKVETLKNEMIDLNLPGLPEFPLYYLQQSIGESSRKETDDSMIGVETSFQDISMDDVPVGSASTVQSEIRVTVTANYGSNFVRFQLYASSGIHELHHQVFQKLELEVDTYLVKYQDADNDWIIIACDEDLREYISTSQENYTLVIDRA